MANDIVKLKGNKYGLTLNISTQASFDLIKEETEKLFKSPVTGRMFGTESIAIGFEGKLLDEHQKDELLDIITNSCSLNIVCVMDFNVGTEMKFRRAVETYEEPEPEPVPEPVQDFPQVTDDPVRTFAESPVLNRSEESSAPDPAAPSLGDYVFPGNAELAENTADVDLSKIAKFYKGNVRSGVVLNEDCSLIIIGDVNTGGEVFSKGNIIVLGALRGNAYAGSAGNNDCFVAALTMNPAQIRIGDIIARSSESVVSTLNEEHEPKIAIVRDNTIAIELINKSVLNDIII
jgi:septum site-determining protein MinC